MLINAINFFAELQNLVPLRIVIECYRQYIFCVDVCREREALAAENIARYQALKMKWKELMRTYQPPLDPDVPESVPLYLRECQSFRTNNDPTEDVGNRLSGAAVEEVDTSHMGDEQLVFLNLTAKVCLLK